MKLVEKYCLLLGFVLTSVLFLQMKWCNIEYFTMGELSQTDKFIYDEKVVLVNNPDYFTKREIVDASLDWLNQEDLLVERDIFGYNKYNEPIRFIYKPQYFSLPEDADENVERERTGVSHLILQKYRAGRWCDEDSMDYTGSSSKCPSKRSPRYPIEDKTRWEHLLAIAEKRTDVCGNELDPLIVKVFRDKYGHLSDSMSMRYGTSELAIVDDFKYYFLGIPDISGKSGGNYFEDKGYEETKIMTEEDRIKFHEDFEKKLGEMGSLAGEVEGAVSDEIDYSFITSPLDLAGKEMKIEPNGHFLRNVPLNVAASSQLHYNKDVGGYCGHVCFKER